MADKTDSELGKKCAQTGTTLKRVKRYYREGKYFVNKNAYKAHQEKLLEEAKKAEDEAREAAEKEAEAKAAADAAAAEAKAQEKAAEAPAEETKAE